MNVPSEYDGIHAVAIALSAVATILFILQMYWDRAKIFHLHHLDVRRSFRWAGFATALVRTFNSIDYHGVYGIYSAPVRVLFRLLSVVTLVPSVLVYIHFVIKPCFPFVFSPYQEKASQKLKYTLIGAYALVIAIVAVQQFVLDTRADIVCFSLLLLIGVTLVVVTWLLYVRLNRVLQALTVGSNPHRPPSNSALPRVARKLLVFNALLTVVLLLIIAMWGFFIVGQVRSLGTEDADVLGEQTFEEANFFDVASEDAFSASIGMFPAILVAYLLLWRSWRWPSEFKNSSTATPTFSASRPSRTDRSSRPSKTDRSRGDNVNAAAQQPTVSIELAERTSAASAASNSGSGAERASAGASSGGGDGSPSNKAAEATAFK